MQIVNERVMRMRLSNHISTACLLPIICMVLIAFMSLQLSMPATAEAQKDTNACLRTSNALYKRGEELYKKRRWQFPAEFRRVASDLDQYCRDKEFKKADIAIDWLNTCLRNYDKQDNQGYCTRGKKLLCYRCCFRGLSHLETVWNLARKCRSDQCEAYGAESAVPLIPVIGATVPAKAIYPRTSAAP